MGASLHNSLEPSAQEDVDSRANQITTDQSACRWPHRNLNTTVHNRSFPNNEIIETVLIYTKWSKGAHLEMEYHSAIEGIELWDMLT